jgi:hypothetical protein
MSSEAIDTLVGITRDKEASASVRARVALGWLKERHDAIELDQLAQRVGALKEKLNA